MWSLSGKEKGIKCRKHLESSSKGRMLETKYTRAQHLSMILSYKHSSRLDYCTKRAENLMSVIQLYLSSMFTNLSKSNAVSYGTNTLAMSPPGSVTNPKRTQVEACPYCFFFPFKTDLSIRPPSNTEST